MKIAVEGCCHGELDAIYQTIEYLEKKNNIKVDLLLICGDFQSVRNTADMECMAVPPKHRKMNTFYKYYSGEKVAPVLTIFIGGNHEASNYLQELPYGGWVAPKIYYMGYAGVVQFGGIRIGGMSGIHKSKDFMKGHFEHPPYSEDTKRSAYHIRNFDVFRLKQVKQQIDIFLSHDWPRGIYKYGNVNKLVKKKKFLAEEIEKDILGNPVAADLLYLLQPTYWFSAHLHVKFPAVVQHSEDVNSKFTKFLALDKCLPRREFLQVIDVPHDSNKPMKLQLDPEWLAILKSTNHLLSLSKAYHYVGGMPGERTDYSPTEAEIEAVKADFGGELAIPDHFEATVPAYDPKLSKQQNKLPSPKTEVNAQTTLICSMLDLTDPNAVFLGKDSTYKLPDDADADVVDGNDGDEDDDDDVDDDDDSEQSFISLSGSEKSFSDRSFSLLSGGNDSILSAGNESFTSIGNPDEISISDEIENNDRIHDNENLNSNNKNENSTINNESAPAKLMSPEKRLSLSEKLKMCPPSESGSSSDTAPSLNTSQDDNDESEIAEIIAAQKANQTVPGMFSPGKSDSDSDVANSGASSSSIDCKSLEITDDDPELQEMLRAQSVSKRTESMIMEVSAENDDVEFQEIVAEQKKNKQISDSLPEFLPGAELEPVNQSSPIVNIENKCSEDSVEKAGLKRMDTPKTIKSPASKKFKRRNQEMYIKEDSVEEF